MKKVTLKFINSLDPCYNPETIGFTKELKLTPIEFIDQFADKVESKADILWLLCRKEFMTDRNSRLFAVWCAREALKLVEAPDERSVKACDVAEKFVNGEATKEDLNAAWNAAWNAARSAAWNAAENAAWNAARSAADSAARSAAESAARSAARNAAWNAARSAAWNAAESAAENAAENAAESAQIEKLKEFLD